MKKSISWPAYLFVGVLALLMIVSFTLTTTGMLLPKSDEASSVSLRDVASRRSHFITHYAFVK